MPNYDTDTQLYMTFSMEFYAANGTEADTIARNTINRIFGAAVAGLMKVGNVTSSALSGEAISGANYVYPYTLDLRMGKSDNATDSDVFATIFAATAADALAALQANAQRITNITNFPLKVRYLRLTP